MAEKTYKSNTYKKAKKNKQQKKKRVIFYQDKRFHIAGGFFLIVLALFLTIAFISFIFTGKADQSVAEAVFDTELKASGLEVENWLGLIGAISGYLFIYRWFGIASMLIPPLLFIIGVKIVFKREIASPYNAFKFVAFFLIWTSILLGYIVFRQEGPSPWGFLGGGVGYELAFLSNSLMGWGTILLLIFSLLVFIIYFFDATTFFHLKPKTKNETQNNSVESYTQESLPENPPIQNREEPKELDDTYSFDLDSSSDQKSSKEKKTTNETPELEVNLPEEEISKDSFPNTPDTHADYELEVEEQKEEKFSSQMENYDPTLDLSGYRYPTPDMLEKYDMQKVKVTKEELENNKDNIVETLINFKIGISSIKATIGPTVTLYEIVPEAGVKISKIKNLEDDIALSLAALGIRIIAPIPGKGTIGIEVPNKNREIVSMNSVVTTDRFMKSNKELPIILGKTVSNELYIADLAKMPHILIAGATGQGKSVGLNVLITSLIFKRHPSQLKFVLIDPKKVELTLYNKIERHFLAKLPDSEDAIITETKKVIYTLNSLCIEMDNRYDLLKDAGCRNIKEYNHKFVHRKLNPQQGHRFLPYIVLIIDELADLMMTAGKEVETPIARLAQLARAIGIHLVVATQRPSVNVITGIIKANFPVRLSFRVTSKVDSRTILDTGGAEQLVGQGDTLLSLNSELIRLQCPFIDTPEVDEICDFIGSQRGYDSAYNLPEFVGEDGDSNDITEVDLKNRDTMFEDAARLIVHHQQGSTSLIQRKLKLGYNRAGRIIDQLEAAGVVGPFEGSKAREVLVQDEYSLEQLLNNIDNK
ncbi:S-DNA-T family DNA segregation ATPase FtsK/SpoIIIE [Catalinimonas alkaloidigena]|uniref:DNA translocase FtsK n=1 Tax=Catalinimonas alkaloidigena TaxID=1075417 RepID=UPI002405440F|nr:DNA translocase FtsK [Catalinimonas alkaloidigena]MDF9797394.1 S-DNA-T family DNA segregation ATPase FtsK/SpoIIIE [Catalinimonas alkaloidigena]